MGEGATSGDGGDGGAGASLEGLDAPAMVDRSEGATGGGGGGTGRVRVNTLDTSRLVGLTTPTPGTSAATTGALAREEY